VRRPLIAIASVILVITPISWILLHEPQSDQADASVPYVTRDDDTYITASTEPAVDTTEAPPTAVPSTPPTPGVTPSTTPGATPTPTSGQSPTPGQSPGTTHPATVAPTTEPTATPTTGTTRTTPPPKTETQQPRPSQTPTSTPTDEPTTPAPPPDPGAQSPAERDLFSYIDSARQQRGCGPLRNNSDLDNGAGAEAQDRAERRDFSGSGSSSAATGGEGMSAKAAFDKLKSENSGTLFNCGLDELGVGRGSSVEEASGLCKVLGLCHDKTNVAWVVDFD
jgi:uncharacterized protein YkwD